MAAFDAGLLDAARLLLERPAGAKGKLSQARIRRSVSTAYYALFHVVSHHTTVTLAGATGYDLTRRRFLARSLTHTGIKLAMEKVRGAAVASDVADLFSIVGQPATPVPDFVRNMASTFIEAQAMRHDADYNLNADLTKRDAELLIERAQAAMDQWRPATQTDRNFVRALALLILLKGRAGRES